MSQLVKRKSEIYEITLAEARHLPEVLRIMRENFYHEETMFKSLSLGKNFDEKEKRNIDDYFDTTIVAAFSSSPCFVAIHVDTKKVVAANVTTLSENLQSGESTDGLETIFSSDIVVPQSVTRYIEYLKIMNDGAKIFQTFPASRCIWEFYAIAVDAKHRKCGLAGDLMSAGIALARNNQISLIFGVFTSNYSRKSAEKVGMKSIMEFDLSKYRDGEGNRVFCDTEPNNIVAVMVLEL